MPARKHKRRRGALYFLLVLVIVGYAALAYMQPLTHVRASSDFTFVQKPQSVTLTWPSFGEGAVGAVGYGVLATHGEQKTLPTASVIKVLTALAVLKQKPLKNASDPGPTITITTADVASYNLQIAQNGSVVAVENGEQITERQALEALLLPSANNMADTLARWSLGSTDKFLSFANSYARDLGMTHTTVTDPSGLDSATISTPGDLIALGEAALASPVVSAIVREPSATIPVQGEIKNYDALLGLRGIVGVKTGNSDADPGCFLLAAERTVGNQKLTILAVLMNAPNLDDALYQTLPLLFSVEQAFTPLTIASAGQTLATYNVPWAKPVNITAKQDITYVAWKDSTTRATLKFDALGGATASNKNVGNLRINNSRVKQTTDVTLRLEKSVAAPSIVWRVTHPA